MRRDMGEPLPGVVLDCACGLRYMRDVLELTAIESARAHCLCGRVLGEWQGLHRLVFEPEEPRAQAIVSLIWPN
jgi:hypothetical protein